MTDAFQEIMNSIKVWMDEEFATYANPRNTYTGKSGKALTPVIYDYIFHKKNTEGPGMIWTKWFYLPFLKTVSSENSHISFAVAVHVIKTLWTGQTGIITLLLYF